MDPEQEPQRSTPDAPDAETREQIRLRRIAKLGALSSSSAKSDAATDAPHELSQDGPSAQSASPSLQAEKKGEEDKEQSARADSSTEAVEGGRTEKPSSDNPFAQLAEDSKKGNERAEPAEQATSSGSVGLPRKRRASDIDPPSAAPPPKQAKPTPKEETIEAYTNRLLSHIFRITVDPNQKVDTFGHRLTFLPSLSQDLQESGAPLLLSTDVLDSAILEAASFVPHNKPLMDYLLSCWKRVNRAIKALRGPSPQKEEVLREARRICFSNCIFALTMPELFSREPNPEHDTLVPYLLRQVEQEDGLCLDFFYEALSRFDEDESIEPLFTKAMVDISAKLSTMDMNDNYKPYVNALISYSKFPRLLNALARSPSFQMAVSAPNIEKLTLLGPFFRISPLQPEATKTYFTGPRTMDQRSVKASQNALQVTLAAHQTDLCTIINAFVRASVEARNKVLSWFAYIMNVNHKRRAMHVDPRDVSSDGFMLNVTVVLDYLCEPFMDSTFSKIDRIDINYFRGNPRVDIKDETKLNADQSQSDAFYAQKIDFTPNFITEVFFLTLAAHHYGSEATNTKLKNLEKDIKFYQSRIVAMEAERPKFANRPDQLALLEVSLKRHAEVLEKAMSLKFAIEGVLLDEKMQSRSLQFMRYVSVWLLRVASQSDYKPSKPLHLPLPEKQPEAFCCLPEYALQDIVDNFKFVFRYIPQIILSAVGEEMIALCITFLESSEYIRNPYLKSSLVSLLFSGTWPTYHLRKGVLGDLLTNSKFANQYLLHAIMKFYIECESTGAHTQFYDKFNIRYEIFQVIKCVWSNDLYKEQLTQQSKSNRAFFVRFVNLLLNDATYVLDEGLTKFPKIHALQEELKDRNLPEQDRQKKEEELQANENQAQSYMQLANETVSMMKLFTHALSEAFTMPEIVQRLAAMLDYNLDILTGPKSKDLRVENPAKYFFSPRTLLPELVDIYLNLGDSAAFVEAVAADGRSYKPENFDATSRILSTKALKSADELQKWEELKKKFAAAKQALDQAELDLGEIPPEFEDPIMGDIMNDPVILPSKHIVDRSTIVQHLLSDPKDPFTRQPMTVDDVVPADELRQQITKWKEERIAARRAAVSDAVNDVVNDAMDTGE